MLITQMLVPRFTVVPRACSSRSASRPCRIAISSARSSNSKERFQLLTQTEVLNGMHSILKPRSLRLG